MERTVTFLSALLQYFFIYATNVIALVFFYYICPGIIFQNNENKYKHTIRIKNNHGNC